MWRDSIQSLRRGEMAAWHRDYMDFMFSVNDINRKSSELVTFTRVKSEISVPVKLPVLSKLTDVPKHSLNYFK